VSTLITDQQMRIALMNVVEPTEAGRLAKVSAMYHMFPNMIARPIKENASVEAMVNGAT
jgi:hypothetical protein